VDVPIFANVTSTSVCSSGANVVLRHVNASWCTGCQTTTRPSSKRCSPRAFLHVSNTAPFVARLDVDRARRSTGVPELDAAPPPALRLDVHFHALFTDGVFACSLGERRATFHPLAELTDDDVARVVRRIRSAVQRFLR